MLRGLHGRLTVINQSPVAALSREQAALVRGLVSAARVGLPPRPWPDAAPDAAPNWAPSWPADSRAAHAAVLAHAWLAAHDADGVWRRAPAVAVGLFEGPSRIALSHGGSVGREHASDVRARISSRLPGRALDLPHIVLTTEYRLVVMTAADTGLAAARPPRGDARIPAALRNDSVVGRTPGAVWFSGSVLLPDAAVVATMDAPARRRWAAFTGRAGQRDAYWFPESWSRFLEPGRTIGCVSAASVARSHPSERRTAGVLGASLDRTVERGVCVPPGYALVDCVGTLATSLVVT